MWKIDVLFELWTTTYEGIRKRLPKVGSIVKTEAGNGEVVGNSIVKEMVKVKVRRGDEEVVEEFKITDAELVSGKYEDTIDENNIKLIVESEEDKTLIKNLINEK